ncbi:hypothetical protein [Streptomyces sioyaensis]|uniref:hypothetical protein n=1 Tax=Streptomyces sioyaensis TaxID=67364 RepID=UPI0037B3FB6D
MAGQSVIPILVSAREKILHRDAYSGATSITPPAPAADAERAEQKVALADPVAAG